VPTRRFNASVKAGSDLSAKSAGGMTALPLADIFQRAEIAAALRKAGAKIEIGS
jgi:hypothetical protein